MQRVTLSPTPDTSPTNRWLASRRNSHICQLYHLFYRVYTTCTTLPPDLKTLATLLNQGGKGDLDQLRILCQDLFPDNNHEEPYSSHLNWAVQAIFHNAIKLQANLKMVAFHHQHHDQSDPGHTAFITGLAREITQQHETLTLLVDNAKELLHLMLCEHTANDLLLRLIIEEAEVTQAMWGKASHALFKYMFPDQPEAGYVQAGKSYFMAQWFEEALRCYETSLNINSGLSEPRKQTYLIRAILKDRDKEQQ